MSSTTAGAKNLRTNVQAPAIEAKSIENARTEFNMAKSNAMKFVDAGMAAAEAAAPKVYKVAPGVKGGLAFEPSAGQNDPAVHIRARADYAEPVKQIGEFLGSHGYKEDVKDLLVEVDKSQNYMKGLKLRIAEKENFVDSLVAREDMLQDDVNKDKQALDNLQAHVKALHARVEKIKKSKQLSELQAQFDEYNAAASKLSSQADQLASVKAALQTKISDLSNQRDALGAQEKNQMSVSIGVGESETTKEPATVDAAATNEAVSPDASGAAGVESEAAAPPADGSGPAE
jgi:phage shock protein A